MNQTTGTLLSSEEPYRADDVKRALQGLDDFLPLTPSAQQELPERSRAPCTLHQDLDGELDTLFRAAYYFSMFVPQVVKHWLITGQEPPSLCTHTCDISVLFIDISGYARLSEQMTPDALNLLVEQYFSTFLDRIYEGGGDIYSIAGDGLMAVFQDVNPQRHACRAADTALAMLAMTERLNRVNHEQPLAVHMGLNSGMAQVGAIRLEGVRGTRWACTANGATIDLASRLADLARPGKILVGPETARRLGNHYALRPLDRASLPNCEEPVDVHCLACSHLVCR